MLREIPLKDFGPLVSGGASTSTGELVSSILSAPPDGPDGRPIGFGPNDLRKAMGILDEFDKAKAAGKPAVLLDEQTYNYLRQRTDAMRWAFFHRTFIQITDDIIQAKSVDPNAPRLVQDAAE